MDRRRSPAVAQNKCANALVFHQLLGQAPAGTARATHWHEHRPPLATSEVAQATDAAARRFLRAARRRYESRSRRPGELQSGNART